MPKPGAEQPDYASEEFDDEIDASGEDEEFFDCHMGNDGQCGAAGSEWCDFECPTMARWRRQ